MTPQKLRPNRKVNFLLRIEEVYEVLIYYNTLILIKDIKTLYIPSN